MTRQLVCRQKAYIQPFERKLALLELSSLSGATPASVEGSEVEFRVSTSLSADTLAGRLAYWEVVRDDVDVLTTQVLREATVNIVRNGVPLSQIREQLPFKGPVPLPNRRALRYGTHGIHEYRGKFFPQLVRSLINVAGVRAGGVVVDPMCGSGTTLVEASLAGHRGIGADINPLSVLMSRTKCALLNVQIKTLVGTYETVRSNILNGGSQRAGRFTYLCGLPHDDQRYLRSWFSEQVLRDLDVISTEIRRVRSPVLRDFLTLALSNVLRSVSWQKKDDLRVRKEIRLDVDIDPIKEFLEDLGRSVRFILAFLYQARPQRLGPIRVDETDARTILRPWRHWEGKSDVVITSPPYATALPYLDTDRLSLSYLGLLSRPEHRGRDKLMIGNREITDRARREYWERFQTERKKLPDSISRLILEVEELNTQREVGFRRRNLAALLSKYFLDMRLVMANVRRLLKTGRPAYVVVGDNHTIAGNERVDIRTAQLLMDLADCAGLRPESSIAMEMLISRDIFRKNAVASESVLCLRKTR